MGTANSLLLFFFLRSSFHKLLKVRPPDVYRESFAVLRDQKQTFRRVKNFSKLLLHLDGRHNFYLF